MSGPVPSPDVDILIVGAGISGIAMAGHIALECPQRSYAILERRANIGGTWDLFRYPGVRSDSDMHTLGFEFQPWTHEDAIADGPAILEYLERTARECGALDRIRFDTLVVSANWDSAGAMWQVVSRTTDGQESVCNCRWLYLASGYYDYDEPYDARLPGLEKFGGEVVHPQFWPQDLDYAGKAVVVVGSGATAVTIVPAMAQTAGSVTMLQRTPTWMGEGPRRDRIGELLRRWLPDRLAYFLTRQKNIALRSYFFDLSRRKPAKVAEMLRRRLRHALGPKYTEEHFEPPYNPWEQRLCLVPDGDLFAALKDERARIVTGHIEGFDSDAVRLTSGDRLAADIVVTATGLKLVMGGKIDLTMDGEPIDFTEHFFYRGAMFSNVPNLAMVFGYLNASWTLRADNVARYVTAVLNHMENTGSTVAMPVLAKDAEPQVAEPFDYTSGYLQRALSLMPKNAANLPWKLNHDYLEDRRDFRNRPVADGLLRFSNPAELDLKDAAE
ncbi:flavin-containing monooxygenase [Aurantiacibacter spongiae]|uniref:NAD(P)/FAD-dependent oxidoreductase n=1 Tax=Aurantiacibacter spongiae TaxID=2488860 RepID=A0A3N5CR08_9SPHN|nr:NAD(P)/FAD-dependent oxidoreductase [Aurantiacibacter spongiae]RPF71057.1 NAD(P)/FAD-dependent oxidoreductase [Aurantiacibacter spongiae]